MKKTQGFTLIELIIVIVILGILAVTAAPKFIDIQDDAVKAVIDGVDASLDSAASMAHAKALIAGTEDGEVTINGASVTMVKGYPDATDIASLIELPSGYAGATSGTTYTVSKTGSTNCQVVYSETGSSNTPPTTVQTVTGC